MRNQYRGYKPPFREKLARFFYGRNGFDTLAKGAWWAALVLMLVNVFFGWLVLWLLEVILYGYAVFRMMSRNCFKRQKENRRFQKIIGWPKRMFRLRCNKWRDRKTHVFRKCPQCKNVLRLPKVKGVHTVNCPCCHNRFDLKI